MHRILIIYPHWPPSNLAGVHRARLTANGLIKLGYSVTVLAVSPEFYEEEPDYDLKQTVDAGIEVEYVNARKITRPRIIGDIGLRAFSQLRKRAESLIQKSSYDFLWIPIPSFYTALLGRQLNSATGIPYGIDYIDPWVRDISTRKDWRHHLSNLLAKILEPWAVQKATLISGVSYEYYRPVLERYFKPKSNDLTTYRPKDVAFPYGFDPQDHEIKLDNLEYPWSKQNSDITPWIYAGAFLPNSRLFVQLLFSVIAEIREERKWDNRIKLFFIGTGNYPGKSIEEYADEAGIPDLVIEVRTRYPFLHILNFLSAADTVMVIGSTEKHYTASKVYQSILSKRPVFAMMHEESSAVKVLEETNADWYLVRYHENLESNEFRERIRSILISRVNGSDNWSPDYNQLEKYSAKEGARKLVNAIEIVLGEE